MPLQALRLVTANSVMSVMSDVLFDNCSCLPGCCLNVVWQEGRNLSVATYRNVVMSHVNRRNLVHCQQYVSETSVFHLFCF
jgi:hypothetical protein